MGQRNGKDDFIKYDKLCCCLKKCGNLRDLDDKF